MSTKWTFVRVACDSFFREVRKRSILPEEWAMLAQGFARAPELEEGFA